MKTFDMTAPQNLFYPQQLAYDSDMDTRKRHLVDLPYVDVDISASFQYEHGSEAVIAIPVLGVAEGVKHHLYAKSSVYAALSYLRHTDIRSRGVPLYLAVGDLYAEEVLPYLKAASIPDAHILVYDQRGACSHVAKMGVILHPKMLEFERLVLVDADVYVHRPDGAPSLDMFAQLLDTWEKPFYWGCWDFNETSDWNWHPFHMEYRYYEDALEPYWARLAALVKLPLSEVKRVFHIDDRTLPRANGWFTGFDVQRTLKDEAFRDFFRQACEFLRNDEAFMSAWIYVNGSDTALWDPPPFWTEDPYFWNSAVDEEHTRLYHLATDEDRYSEDTSMHYSTWKDRWLSDMKRLVSECGNSNQQSAISSQ